MQRRQWIRVAAGAAAGGVTQASQWGFGTLNPDMPVVSRGPTGRLSYATDERGNRIPDFSRAGYGGGGVKLPDAPVKAELRPASGDATERVQRALDAVAKQGGGALFLRRGRYPIKGALRITASGVVLRGEDGSVLHGTGKKQRALVQVHGRSAGESKGPATAITAEYVPVGGNVIPVASTAGFKAGDVIGVRRAGNAAWIRELGMDRITPRPSAPETTRQWTPFDLLFERRIVEVRDRELVIDAPVTCAIERRWGGGDVSHFDDSGRITGAGVENLAGDTEFDGPEDEAHAWSLVSIENANDVWVRNVTATHFGFACVDIGKARGVTVEDCSCTDMVSQITGSRRYSFHIRGQLCLVQRCKADTGRHDFAVGARVCGPNVFLHCRAGKQHATSEPHHRWSVGGLYDNVRANIAIQDRQYMGTGHGWSGANYVVWNCEGSLVLQKPPTAQNWAVGHIGPRAKPAFGNREEGVWQSYGTHVQPLSLYLAQQRDRRLYG